MNSNCGRPRALHAASVMAVVGLALAAASAAHASGLPPLDPFVVGFILVYAAGVVVIGVVGWLVLRAALRSSRPRENSWAAWSLILGLLSLMVGLTGPFAIWTGIKAYRMGGSKWMAVPGIVLGTVVTLGTAIMLLVELTPAH